MLNEAETVIIVAILRSIRKSRGNGGESVERTERDVKDVLNALDIAGYQTLPKGIIEVIKKAMRKLI